jgi:hypothetical protein
VSCVYTLNGNQIKPMDKFKVLMNVLLKEIDKDQKIYKDLFFFEVISISELINKIYIKFIERHIKDIMNE